MRDARNIVQAVVRESSAFDHVLISHKSGQQRMPFHQHFPLLVFANNMTCICAREIVIASAWSRSAVVVSSSNINNAPPVILQFQMSPRSADASARPINSATTHGGL
nr:hypothetical protein CFP56_16614 [Quercus suber]